MTNELNKSGFITAVSIDTTTGGAIGGMGNFVSALRHGVQSLMSPSQSQSDLPTAEPQTAVVGEHSHQPRPGCKFLHICVGKRQYSTRMDHIDICEKRTDRAIFHTLRRHYKEVRRELIGILFKVRRIDFVKFQMGPNGLVYSLVPDQLPPPPPDNLEYEYFPAPPQTRPPICPRFMAHLWHCKEEVPEQNFFCKRFPKKKDTPCIFTSDNEPTANLGWGLHIVEVFNISLIVWILFGFTAISGLIFSISWTLLRDDISGAYAVASYITALTALLLMAITTTIAS
ncbi:hypothetical protein BKA61DRAFT_310461 [Leptodontidium sp. MPI-SDFR-AT-0119]|nr:hypothetical protein BKA61DRAFT_310461 [Leptodontidium sp. MPI-SDFR-AT-0119]